VANRGKEDARLDLEEELNKLYDKIAALPKGACIEHGCNNKATRGTVGFMPTFGIGQMVPLVPRCEEHQKMVEQKLKNQGTLMTVLL
jgi:hypothetical protein